MRNIYQLKTLEQHEGYYSSVEKALRRIRQSGYEEEAKPFHTVVKGAIKTTGTYKNEVFEIIQHPLN